MMQGFLVPADWEAEIVRYEDGFLHGRDAYMPWWGQTDGAHGYTAIVDTFWDAKGNFDHAPRLHSHFGVRWLPALGRYDDNRSVRYRFGSKMDYVDMAKIYRAYVKSIGRFRSMAEKIAENPRVGRLRGAAVVNTLIHFYAVPESDYYDPDHPEKNDERHSFALRAEQLAKLKDAYDGPVYVHLDGWGQRGYDNLHPDVLPPSPVNGGWEGMRLLRQRCEELGYLLALHDQYRDFYHDAPSYGAEQAVMDRDGNNELCTIWPGGAHHFLSASLAKGYVERNYERLEAEGVLPDGAYLDVFAVIALEEDYHPAHPMTRKSCMEHRLSCFHSIRSRGLIASSEEPVDWALPALDLVHHGPYARDPNPGKGPVVGIPVPLFSLVYHDAVFLPWFPGEGGVGHSAGGLGIPARPAERRTAVPEHRADRRGGRAGPRDVGAAPPGRLPGDDRAQLRRRQCPQAAVRLRRRHRRRDRPRYEGICRPVRRGAGRCPQSGSIGQSWRFRRTGCSRKTSTRFWTSGSIRIRIRCKTRCSARRKKRCTRPFISKTIICI
ncbi:DUF5696 domain-containing protein [Cohnella rhizosphaerae]|uniref:DUF5696 domain-containing protein n=1 Tax=Cohnella rhizosphaerae TaxID=1457232 RepID=A0A9X4KU56_9BACL|nr:DUF5696 domain-containing protein [Cohnella rhizosphaerae]MDG0808869.1 DUF5696 domain-containing protein [Cohnella rhizosphaerae]